MTTRVVEPVNLTVVVPQNNQGVGIGVHIGGGEGAVRGSGVGRRRGPIVLAPALRASLEPAVSRWDAIVVGAGPAGAIAAHELTRGGASVLLLDRLSFPRWKVCGACLSPGALAVLDAVGLHGLSARLGAVALHRLVLEVRGRKVGLPLEGSVAVSRSALDHALVEAAVAQGAEFWDRSRVSLGGLDRGIRELRVVRTGIRTEGAARVVVDATGLGPGLTRNGVSARGAVPGSRVGLGATFDDPSHPIEPGELHMVVGRTGYVGLVRVEDGTLNVAAAVDPAALRTAAPESVVGDILTEADRPPLTGTPLRGWRGTPLLTRSRADVGG